MTVYNRFRERPSREDPSFFGNKKGKKIKAGEEVGVVREYTSSGSLLSTSSRKLTGTPRDSYSVERTWDEVHPGPPFKTGGDFANVKVRLPSAGIVNSGTYSSRGNPAFSGLARIEYTGGFLPADFTGDGTPYDDYLAAGVRLPWKVNQFPDLSVYHTKAWDRIRPTVEKAGLSQFLYELRDLPGMLQTTALGFKKAWDNISLWSDVTNDVLGHYNPRLARIRINAREDRPWMAPKEAADHFLNHNFGWVPFVNDLLKFYDTWENSHKYIQDAIRNNGMWVRRRRTVDYTESDSMIHKVYTPDVQPVLYGLYPQLFKPQTIDGISNCYGYSETRLRETKRVWAEGAFTQYRPEFDPNLQGFSSLWSSTHRLLTLYGARINPAVLYSVTPWSWLVDWFTGLGRNIEIATQSYQDSIAAKYAYLMCENRKSVIKTSSLFFWSGTVTCVKVRTLDTKQRDSMLSPYGFDLPWDGLSPKQLAILGAIGLGKVPKRA